MIGPIPTIGRTVLYTLTAQDADAVNRRRSGAGNLNAAGVTLASQNLGAQIHVGNRVQEGDQFPMTIVRAWGDQPESAVNGQVQLDGTDLLWVTSRCCGTDAGTWAWPVIA